MPRGLQAWGTSLLLALADPVFVEAQPIDISATVGLAVATERGAFDRTNSCAARIWHWIARGARSAHLPCTQRRCKPAARDQLSLLGELRHAVEHDEMRLFFQPKIELRTGRVAGAEVLLRWQHPTRGLAEPGRFHSVRGANRLHPPIDALDPRPRHRARRRCGSSAGNALELAVNISADDVGDVRLDSRIA